MNAGRTLTTNLNCPVCLSATFVIDTRAKEGNTVIRRRRDCMNSACGIRLETHEKVTRSLPKGNGKLQLKYE